MSIRVFSNGGGIQSTAALVLSAQGKIDFPIHLFCNTGDDSENPATLDYVRNIAVPYAKDHGIELVELHRVRRGGESETLMEHLERRERSVDIPMRMSNGSPGNRNCTGTFKIRVIARWLREHGATREDPATVGIGISLDEIHRAKNSKGIPYQINEHPLIDLRISRQDCQNIIARAGLPVPPKSSCYFCPFKTLAQWKRLRTDEPELFEKSVALEAMLNERRKKIGKDPMWMTSKLKPLDQAIGDVGQTEFELDFLDTLSCDSGHCFR